LGGLGRQKGKKGGKGWGTKHLPIEVREGELEGGEKYKSRRIATGTYLGGREGRDIKGVLLNIRAEGRGKKGISSGELGVYRREGGLDSRFCGEASVNTR